MGVLQEIAPNGWKTLAVFRIDAEGIAYRRHPIRVARIIGRQLSMKTQLFGWTIATFALVLLLGFGSAGDKDKKDEKPKFKIPEVMKEVMKSGVAKKVFAGEGTKEETAKVLDMFVSLHANTPPKDDKGNWAKVTKTLVSTAQAIADGKEKGSKKLAGLINCGGCHSEFKK
jgi:hypothetical protein